MSYNKAKVLTKDHNDQFRCAKSDEAQTFPDDLPSQMSKTTPKPRKLVLKISLFENRPNRPILDIRHQGQCHRINIEQGSSSSHFEDNWLCNLEDGNLEDPNQAEEVQHVTSLRTLHKADNPRSSNEGLAFLNEMTSTKTFKKELCILFDPQTQYSKRPSSKPTYKQKTDTGVPKMIDNFYEVDSYDTEEINSDTLLKELDDHFETWKTKPKVATQTNMLVSRSIQKSKSTSSLGKIQSEYMTMCTLKRSVGTLVDYVKDSRLDSVLNILDPIVPDDRDGDYKKGFNEAFKEVFSDSMISRISESVHKFRKKVKKNSKEKCYCRSTSCVNLKEGSVQTSSHFRPDVYPVITPSGNHIGNYIGSKPSSFRRCPTCSLQRAPLIYRSYTPGRRSKDLSLTFHHPTLTKTEDGFTSPHLVYPTTQQVLICPRNPLAYLGSYKCGNMQNTSQYTHVPIATSPFNMKGTCCTSTQCSPKPSVKACTREPTSQNIHRQYSCPFYKSMTPIDSVGSGAKVICCDRMQQTHNRTARFPRPRTSSKKVKPLGTKPLMSRSPPPNCRCKKRTCPTPLTPTSGITSPEMFLEQESKYCKFDRKFIREGTSTRRGSPCTREGKRIFRQAK